MTTDITTDEHTKPDAAKKVRKTKAKTSEGSAAKNGSTKAEKVLTLLKRPKGATLEDLTKATDWQTHSVRGFLSGTLKKRMGLTVLSEKDDKGTRRYRIEAEADA